MNNGYRDPDGRAPREPWADPNDRRDFGQVDYSLDYGYDPQRRTGYRKEPEDYAYGRGEPRTWDRAAGPVETEAPARRRGESSDRVLWTLVCDRLRRDRLDSSDIDVAVENGVVILSGTARTRPEKRRAEDLAEIDGVRDVVNTLRLREHGGWRRTFGL
jgi:hypothetical protein